MIPNGDLGLIPNILTRRAPLPERGEWRNDSSKRIFAHAVLYRSREGVQTLLHGVVL
jgi:hypothetical protein